MRILSHITGTVLLFIGLLVIVETMAYWLPISPAYIASLFALGITASLCVLEVVDRWR